MSTHTFRAMFFAIAAALLAGLCAGTPAFAQQETDGAAAEGIRVHGHWIIEVFEGDRLVERREFENALVPEGAENLLRVMAGVETPAPWVVGPSYDPDGTCVPYMVNHFGTCYEGGFQPKTDHATMTIPTDGANAGKLVLVQSYTYSPPDTYDPYDITEVATAFGPCPSSVAPDDCTGGSGMSYVTSKQLASSITVQSGQAVKFTVVISMN